MTESTGIEKCRAAPYANKLYSFKEFSFLNESNKSVTYTVNWGSDAIGQIAFEQHETIAINNNIDNSIIDKLTALSLPSLVGKNNKTVFDEKVRSSHEIMSQNIVLDKSFIE